MEQIIISNDNIEKYIEYTLGSGKIHVRDELKWLIEGLDNPEETKLAILNVVEGQEL